MLHIFYLVSFFPKYYFNKVCFELLQNLTWTDEHAMRVISTNTSINGVRLAHYIS